MTARRLWGAPLLSVSQLLLFGLGLGGCQACDEPGLRVVEPRLEIDPPSLDLGDVPLEVRAQGTLTLRSTGEATLRIEDIRLEGEPEGFGLSRVPEGSIPPGLSEVLVVTFQSQRLGPFEATVVVTSDDPARPVREVRLTARAVEPPPCDDGNVCTADAFDPSQNGCVHTFSDGVACEPADRCIVDAVCSEGVCLGRPRLCDDDNPCTRDFCRQIDGECLFLEETDLCDDGNPCTADSCGPQGCMHEPVPSGVACDDGDLCTVDDACFSGRCTGAGLADGSPCDDQNSCTEGDTCRAGVCSGRSIVELASEGEVLFQIPLAAWEERAFLHRREVSLGDSGTFYGLDHLNRPNNQGLIHVVVALRQCGTMAYEFRYQPPDANVQVSFVRRAIQVDPRDHVRLVVGVRQRPEDGFRPHTTTYLLDETGEVDLAIIQRPGGETGRSLLPDGSEVFGVIFPLSEGPPTSGMPSRQNLVVVREDVSGTPLWRHERASGEWAEFLGVAGPRVLFWALGRFGALDFNTGATVWTRETPFTSDEMALSTVLNLGIIRTKPSFSADGGQLIAVEILSGFEVFQFPPASDQLYFPRTEPVIGATGVIGVMMQRNSGPDQPERLEWVELDEEGQLLSTTPLPYQFPSDFGMTRHEDFRDDPYPTVADDGITYVGYGDTFWAIEPSGGGIRWSFTSTLSPNAFTGTVPLLRGDGVLLVSEASRRIIGIRTNGGRMSEDGWASFRHDGRRTNYTPAPSPSGPN